MGERKRDTVSGISAKSPGQDLNPAAPLRAPFSTPHRDKTPHSHPIPSDRPLPAPLLPAWEEIPAGRRARPGAPLSGGTGCGGLGQPRARAGTSAAAAAAGPGPARRGSAGPDDPARGSSAFLKKYFIFVFAPSYRLPSPPKFPFGFGGKKPAGLRTPGKRGKAGGRPSLGVAPPGFPRPRRGCSQLRAGGGGCRRPVIPALPAARRGPRFFRRDPLRVEGERASLLPHGWRLAPIYFS